MKKKIIQTFWIVGSIICSSLLNSCSQYDDVIDSQKTQNVFEGKNQELTISAAKIWYQQHNAPVTKVVCSEKSSGVLIMPSWNHAKEWKKNNFEVVETALKTQASIMFYNPGDPKDESGDKSAKNVGRMVIIKNTKTGQIANFTMVIIGSDSYLKKHSSSLSNNNYLYRDADFDGIILFFNKNGYMLNGWKYENGKITRRLSPRDSNEDPTLPLTRSHQECETVDVPYVAEVCPGDEYSMDGEFGFVITHTDCYYETGSHSVYSCKMVDDGNAGGSDDQPGSGGSASQSTPAKYTAKSTDHLAKNDLPTTMTKQINNACVTSIMQYIDNDFFGGSKDENVFMNAYHDMTGQWVVLSGVNLSYMPQFVDKFFTTTNIMNYPFEIDSGYVVMTDIPSTMENSAHSIVVVGYQANGDLIYMDPEIGEFNVVNKSYLRQDYIIVVTGIKRK